MGVTGVDRIVQRSAELMKQDPNEDARAGGGIDLVTIQKYVDLWYSLSLDLFGGEISSNAADFFSAGLKGRYHESKQDEHTALNQYYQLEVVENDRMTVEDVPLRNAMNEVLRDAFVKDCEKGIERWNRSLAKADVPYRFTLPHRRFHRGIGIYSDHRFDRDGNMMTEAEWAVKRDEWLPSEEDKIYVKSLMKPVIEPGKMAGWIAGPKTGINGQEVDFEYVRTSA